MPPIATGGAGRFDGLSRLKLVNRLRQHGIDYGGSKDMGHLRGLLEVAEKAAAEAAGFAQILSPDANLLCSGEEPKSYAAVLTCLEELFGRYGAGDAERSTIKEALRRLGAHLNPFARGAVSAPDISVDDFFRRLKAAAQAAMTAMTKGQHDKAVHLGLARLLDLPKDTKKGKLKQDSFMPFLAPKFKKKIAALLLDERYAQLDPDEVCAVMILFVGEFVDGQLKAEGLADHIRNFLDAPNKEFLRVMVKLLSDLDYAKEKNPPAHLLDVVRRSATAPLADQEVCARARPCTLYFNCCGCVGPGPVEEPVGSSGTTAQSPPSKGGGWGNPCCQRVR